jgi:hypothetical protein
MVNSVGTAASATSLVSSLNPSNPGDFVMFTASVSPAAATGTVTFLDGAATLANVIVMVVAQYSTASLSAGSHSITARYNGDTNYNGSNSPVLTETVNGVSKTSTCTSLASSLNPSTYGQTVRLTSTVSSSSATGTVSFFEGSSLLGTAALSSGRAQVSISRLTAGYHAITASYGGDSNYNGSISGTVTQTVNSPIDSTPPTIRIISPAAGATVSGTVAVLVAASDNVGVVTVDLYVDGVYQATSTSAPFTTYWKAPGKPGPHTSKPAP